MKNAISILSCLLFVISTCYGQMIVGNDTLYGNEWINHNQTYYKIEVSEDAIYSISGQELINAGVPVSSVQGSEWQLFHLGQEIPIMTTTNSTFGANDYIEFYGEQNRAALDSFLFENPTQDLLNPYYSLYTDTSVYYLTWSSGVSGLRYQSVTNNLTNPPAKEDFFMYDLVDEYHSSFIKKRASGYIYDSVYEGDGFALSKSQNRTMTYNVDYLHATGSQSTLQVRLLSAEDGLHQQLITVDGNVVQGDTFYGMDVKQYSVPIATSSIGSTMQVVISNHANNNDRHALAYVKLTYPHQFNFDNTNYFEFYIDASTSDKYLEIENFNADNGNGGSPILLDLTNNIAINTTYEVATGLTKVVIPPSPEKRRLILYQPSLAPKTIANIKAVNFIDFSQMDGNYIIISNSLLYDDPASNTNWVQEYADYRSSTDGGGYNSVIVDVKDIYESFGYGIQRHALSLRNFGNYIVKEWSEPKYIFMIGKGVEYKAIRTSNNLSAQDGINFFIPTFGFVGSDNLLFAGPNQDYPVLPIGRLAARTPNQVRIYLEKVQEFEENQALPQTLEDKAWMKRIVHLGGGDPTIQTSIRNHLNNFKSIIENNEYGGQVTSVFKSSSDPIQISQSDLVTDIINNGVSLITFFGHSYTGGFDVSLDEPELYENQGRYPLLVSFGCYSGRIHSTSQGVSERFVLIEDKGTIAFMSSNGLATVSALRNFGDEFYHQLGDENYGAGIGDVMLATNINVNNAVGSIARQMTLHGDPAIRLNTHEGPDYLVDASSVEFTPNTIDIQEDSFDLQFSVSNIGKHLPDSLMVVRIVQELPTGNTIEHIADTVKTPNFENQLSYKLPTVGDESVGLNTFYITVDAANQINELPLPDAELNNDLENSLGNPGIEVHFISNNIRGIYPFDQSVLGNNTLTLKATSSNVFAGTQTYKFEIDTTALFNSPSKLTQTVTTGGSVVSWQPAIAYQDSMVYYWRVSADSISSAGYNWDVNSFQYIDGLTGTGWSQAHYFQFGDNRYFNMRLENSRKIDFIDDFKDLFFQVLVNNNSLNRTKYVIDNGDSEIDRTGFNKFGDLMIAVFDSVNIAPWINPPGGLYGAINEHSSKYLKAFWYYTDNETEREKVINFLKDTIPDGNYVLFMTLQRDFNYSYEPELWAADSVNLGTNIFEVLENQGATKIRNTLVTGAVPYVFLYQKGKNVLYEEVADTITDIIAGNVPIPGSWDNGHMTSSLIGPAQQWSSLHWHTSSDDPQPIDEYDIDILGVDNTGEETIIYEGLTTHDTVLTFIDANTYPYLKLKYNSIDTSFKTSAHLENWRVMYQGVPEFVLSTDKHYEFYNDTLQQGEAMNFEIGVENISHEDSDSLLVKYTVRDKDNTSFEKYQRVKAIPSGDTAITSIRFETFDLQDASTLTVQVNPNQDQLEQFVFNNTGVKNFYVKGDGRHPLLDVTFDGVHILDGDIVSSTPQILMQLKDENPYLALSDTSAFKVWLVDEEGNQIRQFIDGQTMIFYPADERNLETNNTARIEFNPTFDTDGVYQLIIQTQDRSGNSSGTIDYKISFEVVTASAISYVLNYPNPFTTSTQFVFTLTGAQIPDQLRISIYTVSGRLVKTIEKEELGPLRIGLNRTEYRWDGTDDFGDRLANGVYLYKVTATINGEQLDNHYTRASPYFHNGFGKMVIVR